MLKLQKYDTVIKFIYQIILLFSKYFLKNQKCQQTEPQIIKHLCAAFSILSVYILFFFF